MSTAELEAWVVDDDQSVRWVLEKALRQAGISTRSFDRAEHLLAAIDRTSPDVLITDIRMPGMDGLALLDRLSTTRPDLPAIVMTAHTDLDHAVAAYRGGAFEYLPKPFDVDEAIHLVRKAARRNGVHDKSAGMPAKEDIPSMLGKAPAMQEVFRSIGRLAKSSLTVLITGESGTGKELVARALHQHSPRADKAFVALNTSAIAADLLESELFGHERGAYTGADSRVIGKVGHLYLVQKTGSEHMELLELDDIRSGTPAGWSATNDDFRNLDPCLLTPWGTILTGEEADGGRAFEIMNPFAPTGPYVVHWRSKIPAATFEGIRFDAAGTLYFSDEDNSGSIYKFVPSVPGNSSSVGAAGLAFTTMTCQARPPATMRFGRKRRRNSASVMVVIRSKEFSYPARIARGRLACRAALLA